MNTINAQTIIDQCKAKASRKKTGRINRMMQDADPLHDGIDPATLPAMEEADFVALIDDLTDRNDHTRALWAKCVRSGRADLQARAYELLRRRKEMGGLRGDMDLEAQSIRSALDQQGTPDPLAGRAPEAGPVPADAVCPPVVEFFGNEATPTPVVEFLSMKGYRKMNEELKAHRARYARGVHFFAKVGLCEGWAWDCDGEFFAVAFMGRSGKPWSRTGPTGSVYRFKTREKRLAWIRAAFEQAAYIHNRREASKAERAKMSESGHKLAVGTVLYTSWGYEQTNIDFYEVVGLVGKSMVEVRKIAQECKSTGFMQDDCIPMPGQYVGEAMRCKVRTGGESVKIDGQNASPLAYTEPVPGLKVYRVMHSTSYA